MQPSYETKASKLTSSIEESVAVQFEQVEKAMLMALWIQLMKQLRGYKAESFACINYPQIHVVREAERRIPRPPEALTEEVPHPHGLHLAL